MLLNGSGDKDLTTTEAPRKVHASPFDTTADDWTKHGQIWWLTNGAVNSLS